MGPYLPLLSLTVAHAYYGDAPCPALRFVPSERTHAWLGRSACIVRDRVGGFDVYQDAAETDRLQLALDDPDEMPWLSWWARCDDPLFASYTDGLPRDLDHVLAFDSAAAEFDADRSDWRLHAAPAAGPDQAVAWPHTPPGEEAPPHLPVPPAFVVTLRLPPGIAAWRYRVRFAARAPVWKYCLLGDWDSSSGIRVVDPGNEADFAPAEAETLAGGRAAMAIRSRAGIALQYRPPQRFQLRGSNGGGAERVLIKRLPAAGARGLVRETIDGAATWVSEILVHR